MCIHTNSQAKSYNAFLEKSNSPYRVISLKNRKGQLVAAWPTLYENLQAIANTVRDIKSWHTEQTDYWNDFQWVNEARLAKGLEALDSDGLPFPVGEALPQDMDVDLVMRNRDDFTEFEKGLNRYVQAQKKQLEEVAMVGA